MIDQAKSPLRFNAFLHVVDLYSVKQQGGLNRKNPRAGVRSTPLAMFQKLQLNRPGFSRHLASSLRNAFQTLAVVTNDYNHRYACEDGEQPFPDSWASRVGFFDERDLITFPSTVKQRRKRIRDQLAALPPNEQAKYQFVHADELEALERKQRATEKLSELIARHD